MSERCAERFDSLPTSSDHLWNADHHGIPVGDCVRCGESIQNYNERQRLAAEVLMPEYFQKHMQESAIEQHAIMERRLARAVELLEGVLNTDWRKIPLAETREFLASLKTVEGK